MANYNEFSDVKWMFNLLREQDNEQLQEENFTLNKENDFYKEQSTKVKELAKGTMLSFNPINVDYNLNNFEWALTMNGNLELIFKISNDESGLYVSSDTLKMEDNMVRSLSRLLGYFEKELMPNVIDKLENKDF